MSMFSKALGKIGKGAKKLVTNPKKWAENAGRSVGGAAKVAAPFLPPGFRQVASYGGSLAAGDNKKEQLMSVLGAELGSLTGGRSMGQSIAQGAGAIKSGGLQAVRRVMGGGAGGVPQVTKGGVPIDIGSLIGTTGEVAAPAAGGGGGWGQTLMTGAKRVLGGGGGAPGAEGGDGGIDWLGLAEGGLAGLSAINAAESSRKAGKYQQAGLDQAKARWAQGAPLRAAGQQRLLNPVRPDLTGVFNDPLNAFSAPVPRPMLPTSRRPLLPRPV